VAALGAVRYERNTTVLHTDMSFLPRLEEDWATVTLGVNPEATASDCTIWMNRVDCALRAQLQHDVYQTWNPITRIAEEKVVARFEFERPVLTLASEAALELLGRLNGQDRIWFVGAYTLYTMPLLESGTRSAIRVANQLLLAKRAEVGGILRELERDRWSSSRRSGIADVSLLGALKALSVAALVGVGVAWGWGERRAISARLLRSHAV
jgi:predicted NAD/FAD-binding protein